MTDLRYDIVFNGQIREGFSVDEAARALSKRTAGSEERIRKALTKQHHVFKHDVAEGDTDRYVQQLFAAGVIVDAVLVTESTTSPTDLSSSSADGSGGISDTKDDSGPRDQPQKMYFQFHGNGAEYFKIWIVNICLSIVTLGIYSAWAKVRNKRYFYGNTTLDGSSFEYLASPITILKGRIVAIIVFGSYAAVNHFYPIVGSVLALAFMILMPWVMVRSFAFNAFYSAYRGVRFRFNGTYGGALAAFVGYPILAAFTLGLLAPLAYKKQVYFFAGNHEFGQSRFEVDASTRDFFIAFITGFCASLVAALVAWIIGWVIGVAGLLAALTFYLCTFVFFAVLLTNLVFNNLTLALNQFTGEYELKSYAVLFITNTLGVICTLGLFIPFAKVRAAKYKAEHTGFIAGTNMDEFIAARQESSRAMGEELAEVFDWDFGI
ncbi:MAG: YjgN family protein [Pseudomonadota bacterium]